MTGAKRYVAKHLAVCAKGDFVLSASIQIIEDHVRQTALRQSPEILDVDGLGDLMPAGCLGHEPSQGNAPLPGYKIVLGQPLCRGFGFSAGDLDDAIQKFFAHLLDALLTRNHATGVDVDDVRHARG